MRQRLLCSAAIAGLCLLTIPAGGQTPAAKPSARAAGATTWTPPKTPDGRPDIQGYWEGGAGFDEKGFDRPDVRTGPAGDANCNQGSGVNSECAAYVQLFTGFVDGKPNFGRGAVASTAPVRPRGFVDVPDGKLPWSQAGAAKRADLVKNMFEPPSLAYVDPTTRCVPIVPRGGPGGTQMVQVPGYLAILQEFNHLTRVIPVDGRRHVNASIRLPQGDSVGRWEGNTLLIDTTNFVGGGWYDLVGTPQSDALHMLERITPFDPNTMDIVITIDDPKLFTRPWSYSGSFRRSESAEVQQVQTIEILENACHEGSMAVENIMERPGRPLPPEPRLPR